MEISVKKINEIREFISKRKLQAMAAINKELTTLEQDTASEIIFIKFNQTELVGIVKLINRIKNMAEKKSKTSIMATVKVLFGMIAAIVGLFGVGLPEGTENAVTGIATGGYFLFSWIQGFFTKDDKTDAE